MKPNYIIFPDASLKRCGNTREYCGYGVVVLDTSTNRYITDSDELHGKTIAYGEGYAVYRGLQLIESFRRSGKGRCKVLVVSDSKTTVNAFNVWMRRSWNMSDYSSWTKRNGDPVRNQKVFRLILNWCASHSYKMKIVHIYAHAERDAELRTAIRKRMSAYRVKINDATLDVFIQLNQLADQLANAAASYYKATDGIIERLIPIR